MINIKPFLILLLLVSNSCAFLMPTNLVERAKPPTSNKAETKLEPKRTFIRPSLLLKRFNDLFPAPFRTFDDFFLSSLMTDEFDHQADIMLNTFNTTCISPSYEVTEDENEVKVVLDVPGVKAEDMNLETDAKGRILHLTGRQIKKDGDNVSESRFNKRFSLGGRTDASKVRANLSDGVLTIVAPKETKKRNVQKVFITEGPEKAK